MPEMTWTLSVKVSGGPSLTAAADKQDVEATDSLEIVVAAGAADKVVDLQPGTADDLRLLVIRSSSYGGDLTYKVSDGATSSDVIALDAPQVFSGGNAGLFGRDPLKLEFSNSGDEDVTVQILVARDATA